MKYNKLLLLSWSFFLPLFAGNAQTVDVKLATALQRTLDSMHQVLNVKGLGVALQLPNDAVWSGAAGVSSLSPLVNVGAKHAFAIGSVTKTITAACILQLADEGVLGLDDRLHQWLDTFPFINPNITIQQLLRHQSGIYDVITNPDMQPQMWADRDKIWTLTETITTFIKAPAFQPGASWAYSNTNYLLLGMIIEAATGNTYYQEMRDRFVVPLGLKSFAMPPFETLPPQIAHLWIDLNGDGVRDDSGDLFPNWASFNSSAGPAGSYYATPADMAKWMRAYMSGKLLSVEKMNELKTTVSTAFPAGTRYGLGIMDRNYLGLKSYGHGGDVGYSASVVYFPLKDLSIAVLNNDSGKNSWALAPVVQALLKTYLNYEQNLVSIGSILEGNEELLHVFPNPFFDRVQADLELPASVKKATLVLDDGLGQTIQSVPLAGLRQGNQATVLENLATLPPGPYYLTIWLDGAVVQTVRLLKAID